jgi:hypothetical protein
MTRYNYKECKPKEHGFYKLYCNGSGPFAGIYGGLFAVGPYMGGALMIHPPMKDEDVTEWEIWK